MRAVLCIYVLAQSKPIGTYMILLAYLCFPCQKRKVIPVPVSSELGYNILLFVNFLRQLMRRRGNLCSSLLERRLYSRLTNVHVLTRFNPASGSVRYHTYQIIIFSSCLSKDSVLQIKVFLPQNEDLVKALNSTVVYYNQSPSFSFRICLYNITSILY